MLRDQVIYVSDFGYELSFHLTAISDPKVCLPVIEEAIVYDSPIGGGIFFDRLQSITSLSRVKGLVFIYQQHPPVFFQFYNFRERCRDFCRQHGIICHFTMGKTLMVFTALAAAKVKVFEKETIVVCSPRGEPAVVWIVGYRNGRYHIDEIRHVPWMCDHQNWRNKLIGFNTPNKVVFLKMSWECSLRRLIPAFKNLNPIILEDCYFGLLSKACVDKIQELAGDLTPAYNVVPLTENFFLMSEEELLVTVTNNGDVPNEASYVVTPGQSIFWGLRSENIQMQELDGPLESIDMKQFNGRKVRVTLRVDVDSLFEYTITPELPEIEDINVRVALSENRFSVSLHGNYPRSSAASNYVLKNAPYLISFASTPLIFGEQALHDAQEYPSFVVYDLMKLLSISTNKAPDPNWTFKLDYDDTHPVLVEVETENGPRQYSPAFLMALIFKWILVKVKASIGHLMAELDIIIDVPKVNNILKENLAAVSNMLKVKFNYPG